MQIRVQLGFTHAADHSLEETAGAVADNLYTSALWAVPPAPARPVDLAALTAATTAFTEAIAAQAQGGTAATAAKENRREELIALLRQLALYVQENHGNDMAKLLASGFEAVSTNRTSVPLDTPSILDILNAGTGALKLRVDVVKNARMYEVRHALLDAAGTPGPWVSAGVFNSTRDMTVTGLTPGGNYTMQVRALGGSTGQSEWSNAVTRRSL